MGGTLAAEAARGPARGARGPHARRERQPRHAASARGARRAEAARILGVAHRESLGLPDARLAPGGRAAGPRWSRALRRLRPRVVLTQHWEQRHPDHAAASRLVYDACFVAGLRNYRPDLGAGLPSAQDRLRARA